MSYRDPKQVIDTRYQALAQGIQNFYTTINQSVNTVAAAQREKIKKAEKDIESARKAAQAEYVNTQVATNAWMEKVTDKEDADDFKEQIKKALMKLDDDMNAEIKAGGTSLSEREINDIMIKYVGQMKQLHTDVDHLAAAYQEWTEAKELNPDDEGAIVDSFPPALLSIFKSWDDGKRNVQLLQGNDGKWELAQWDLSKPKNDDGSYNVVNAINTTDWSTKASKDGRYFKHAEKVDLGNAEKEIKKLMDQGVISKEEWQQKTMSDGKIKNVKTMVLDPVKYNRWKDSEHGKEFADSYVNDSNAEGQWQMMGGYTTKPIDPDDPKTLQGMYTSYDDDGQPVKEPT